MEDSHESGRAQIVRIRATSVRDKSVGPVQAATQGRSAPRFRVLALTEDFAKAKVADLYIVVGIDEDVGRLDVAVQDAAAVRVLQTLRELDEELPKAFLADECAGLRVPADEALQVTAAGKLHDNVQRAALKERAEV